MINLKDDQRIFGNNLLTGKDFSNTNKVNTTTSWLKKITDSVPTQQGSQENKSTLMPKLAAGWDNSNTPVPLPQLSPQPLTTSELVKHVNGPEPYSPGLGEHALNYGMPWGVMAGTSAALGSKLKAVASSVPKAGLGLARLGPRAAGTGAGTVASWGIDLANDIKTMFTRPTIKENKVTTEFGYNPGWSKQLMDDFDTKTTPTNEIMTGKKNTGIPLIDYPLSYAAAGYNAASANPIKPAIRTIEAGYKTPGMLYSKLFTSPERAHQSETWNPSTPGWQAETQRYKSMNRFHPDYNPYRLPVPESYYNLQ